MANVNVVSVFVVNRTSRCPFCHLLCLNLCKEMFGCSSITQHSSGCDKKLFTGVIVFLWVLEFCLRVNLGLAVRRICWVCYMAAWVS